MTAPLQAGFWPVMLTPFHDDGTIDWTAVDALTAWYIGQGAAGLFACCLSSEMLHLYHEERYALARRVVAAAGGRVPVIATGNFGGSLAGQLESIRRMADTGVQAVVLLPNMLAPPDLGEGQLRNVVEQVLREVPGVPLGLYECPKPTKRLLSSGFLAWAAGTGRFLYHKDTSGDFAAITAKLDALRGTPLAFTTAHTPTVLRSLRAGAAGCCPIAGNYYPHLYARLWRERDQPSARRLQSRLTALERLATRKYPLSAKHFLRLAGVSMGPRCRAVDYQWTAGDQAALGRLQRHVQALGG